MPRTNLGNNSSIAARRRLLYSRYGGYMTTANVMKELGGVSRPTAMKFLADLPVYSPTGKKVYDIMDVAAKIERSRVQS